MSQAGRPASGRAAADAVHNPMERAALVRRVPSEVAVEAARRTLSHRVAVQMAQQDAARRVWERHERLYAGGKDHGASTAGAGRSSLASLTGVGDSVLRLGSGGSDDDGDRQRQAGGGAVVSMKIRDLIVAVDAAPVGSSTSGSGGADVTAKPAEGRRRPLDLRRVSPALTSHGTGGGGGAGGSDGGGGGGGSSSSSGGDSAGLLQLQQRERQLLKERQKARGGGAHSYVDTITAHVRDLRSQRQLKTEQQLERQQQQQQQQQQVNQRRARQELATPRAATAPETSGSGSARRVSE
jgi:hypothetical protein